MVTGAKSFFLKAIDPFFSKGGAGTVLPITITGTEENPVMGVTVFHKNLRSRWERGRSSFVEAMSAATLSVQTVRGDRPQLPGLKVAKRFEIETSCPNVKRPGRCAVNPGEYLVRKLLTEFGDGVAKAAHYTLLAEDNHGVE